jgi:hypothetical protein
VLWSMVWTGLNPEGCRSLPIERFLFSSEMDEQWALARY